MKLVEKFKEKKQFIPYITCGFPNKKECVNIIKMFLDKGVEIIEIGIPFSDPVADGPTIQYSSYVALQNGINIEDVFEVVELTMEHKNYFPIIMTYLNPVVIYGMEKFFMKTKQRGVKGVIFADVIVEEKEIFYSYSKKYNIDSIFLLSPTTSLQRRRLIYKYSDGFIYILTLTGTTGARDKLPVEFYKFIKYIRKETNKPICAGFGISSPQQVLPVIKYIDGFIVGSAIVDKIREKKYKELEDLVDKFLTVCN